MIAIAVMILLLVVSAAGLIGSFLVLLDSQALLRTVRARGRTDLLPVVLDYRRRDRLRLSVVLLNSSLSVGLVILLLDGRGLVRIVVGWTVVLALIIAQVLVASSGFTDYRQRRKLR
jgi:hypothetical protein